MLFRQWWTICQFLDEKILSELFKMQTVGSKKLECINTLITIIIKQSRIIKKARWCSLYGILLTLNF